MLNSAATDRNFQQIWPQLTATLIKLAATKPQLYCAPEYDGRNIRANSYCTCPSY